MPAASNPQMGGVLDPTRDLNLQGGLTVSTPQVYFQSASVTATGATGTTAATLPSVTPCVVMVTGASGAGVALPRALCVPGAMYVIKNGMTGDLNVYAVGVTINGTTGTTAVVVSATGNLGGTIFCVTAGAWQTVGMT